MDVRQDTDDSLLPAVNAARRAIVFLTVAWSVHERFARMAFRAATEHLAATSPDLDIEFFSLEEDAQWCQTWLDTLGVQRLGDGYSLGAGSILWLESGQVLSYEIGGCNLKPRDVVARAYSLWARQAEPGATANGGRDPRS